MKPALIACLAVVFSATSAGSGPLTSSSRAEIFERQKRVLDGRAAEQYAHSSRLLPERPAGASSFKSYAGRYRGEYLSHARAAARRHGVPEDLFLRLVQQESGWNPDALSHKGAMGLAQLMPQTARILRVDPRDPLQNLEGGARYLAQQYRKFRDWRLALAAYNAGPLAVEKYGGVPPYRETQGYVKAILGG